MHAAASPLLSEAARGASDGHGRRSPGKHGHLDGVSAEVGKPYMGNQGIGGIMNLGSIVVFILFIAAFVFAIVWRLRGKGCGCGCGDEHGSCCCCGGKDGCGHCGGDGDKGAKTAPGGGKS